MRHFSIKIESVPKHAPLNAKINVQLFSSQSLDDVRAMILRQRIKHQKESKWFKIYEGGNLILDSKFIK